jgi:hypothetical protein
VVDTQNVPSDLVSSDLLNVLPSSVKGEQPRGAHPGFKGNEGFDVTGGIPDRWRHYMAKRAPTSRST